MKKFFAIILTAAMLISAVAVPAFADDEDVVGGLDFYSLTIHYESPIVVDYKTVDDDEQVEVKDALGNTVTNEDGTPVYADGYLFNDARDTYTINAVEFTYGDVSNQSLTYGESVLKNKKYQKLFYAINSTDLGIDSSNIAVNSSYGLTDITNNTAIKLQDSVSLLGVQEYFDDAGNPNPNFQFVDGYFIDSSSTEEVTYRIDANGYVIDANGIWHSKDGRRIEPFIEMPDGSFVWINIEGRIGSNGLYVDYKEITNASLVEKGVLSLPDEYATLAEEFDSTVDYDGDGTPGKAKDKTAYKALVKEKEAWLENCSIELYRIDFKDMNEDGKKTEDDLPLYNDPSLVITEADIMTKTLSNGETIKVTGTPVQGTPISTAKITGVTVEIDALGDQIYSDVTADPQQKNVIYISLGDLYVNVQSALDFCAENPSYYYTDGQLVGTAKSVTTKTEYVSETGAFPSTVTSVNVELNPDIVWNNYGAFCISFGIETAQPEAAGNITYITKKDYNLLTINAAKLDTSKLPEATATPAPDTTGNGCFGIIGGNAIVLVMGAAVVLLKKKRKF